MKDIQTILLGQRLKICIDHKKLTCKFFNDYRVLRLIILLEEYVMDIEYIQGKKNIVADTLLVFPNNGNKKTIQ